jgi:hypothetical protein
MNNYEVLSEDCRVQIDATVAFMKSTLYPAMGEREEDLMRSHLSTLVKDCLSIEAQKEGANDHK